MLRFMGLALLCAAASAAFAAPLRRGAETFVIQAGQSGREATIRIPVGAISRFSANDAEALAGYTDVEAMRLRGDVLINVVGTRQPILIRGDDVVLELTANETPRRFQGAQLRSKEIIVGGDDTQTFVGNVVFTLPTPDGAVEIKADRVEHRVWGMAGF